MGDLVKSIREVERGSQNTVSVYTQNYACHQCIGGFTEFESVTVSLVP